MANANTGIKNNAGLRRNGERYGYGYGRQQKSREVYPNRRLRIIKGSDLTTKKVNQKNKVVKQQKININIKTVKAEIKTAMPVKLILGIILLSVAVLGLICSYIVLADLNAQIVSVENLIEAEQNKNAKLERELELKNESANILESAIEKYGMIKVEFIQKLYINPSEYDKVVAYSKNGFLENIFSFIWKKSEKSE